jgi:hypothetical protein
MEGVLDAKYIGRGVIDDIECEHLAFRNDDTDWQIWIQFNPAPIPRKYVSLQGVNGSAAYTLQSRLEDDVAVAADAFTFTPPPAAKQVDIGEMSQIDEVPLTLPP